MVKNYAYDTDFGSLPLGGSGWAVFPLNTVKYWYETNRTAALAPIEEIESLYKEVLLIALSDSWLYKEVFTQNQIDRLREIAELCPMEKGRAVYAARVLLTYLDMPYVDYRNDCENVPAPRHSSARKATNTEKNIPNVVVDNFNQIVSIYPNPNNGTFNVNIANNEPAKIEIVDVIGQIMLRETCTNKKVINTENNLLSGVYLCKIIQNNKVVYQTKLIIKR